MTKTRFERPTLPKDATEEDRRKAMFDALYSLDLSDKLERRENDKLSYLSWANAWAEFKRAYPNAEYRIIKDPTTNLPYFNDPAIGIMVYTEVAVDGQAYEMWLPVMDAKNKAMKEQAYTYQVYDGYKKQYVEKAVQAATMFDVNKAIMRCLVKTWPCSGLDCMSMPGRICQMRKLLRRRTTYKENNSLKGQKRQLLLRPQHPNNLRTSIRG